VSVVFVSRKFSCAHAKKHGKTEGGVKTPASNLMPFAPFTGLPPLHKLDQKMMRRLRKLADQTGWTVERCIREAIADFVAKHPAEEDAPAKPIKFP
jgi:hypothetical protein